MGLRVFWLGFRVRVSGLRVRALGEILACFGFWGGRASQLAHNAHSKARVHVESWNSSKASADIPRRCPKAVLGPGLRSF